MASTLAKILLHITFSTKERANIIPESLESDLYSYVGGICRRSKHVLLALGGTANHVHMLASAAKVLDLPDLMLNVKRDSSKWMKEKGVSEFRWQDGYFAFSTGESGVARLRRYIARQKEHHKAVDYKDEMRAFLRKYGIEWDERYAWD